MLRPTPVPTRAPTGASHLEPPAPSTGPAGCLTFRLRFIRNAPRDGSSHRVSSSQLCAVRHRTRAGTDLTAAVLGLLTGEGQTRHPLVFTFFSFFYCFIFTPGFFLMTRLFCVEQWFVFVF